MTRFTQTITVDGKTATDTMDFRGGFNQAIRALKMRSRATPSIHFAKLRKEGRVEHTENGFHVVWTLEDVSEPVSESVCETVPTEASDATT